MSPRPAANSGRDNLGNYLILPFCTACLAYFLEYQMRPAKKIRQEQEASASGSVSSAPPPQPPCFPRSDPSGGSCPKDSLGNTGVFGRRWAVRAQGPQE